MGRRGPLIAGVAGLALAVLLVFFLVLPKMNEVTEAKTQLAEAQAEQGTLESRLRALESAQQDAPKNQATIAGVDRQIPPTADVPSVILQLDTAATQASLDLKIFTPATPVFDATTGLSVIGIQVSVEGTYFELDEFLYLIETLPRAAKVLSVSIAPATAGTSELAMQATVQVFTSDTSAGPGSSPGPTEEAPGGAAG
jgi:Tfp pilus assembly protein PilO